MLANSKPLSPLKEGFRNRISVPSLMRRLNVLLSLARTFVLLESTECPVSWQCSWTADESLERCSLILVSTTREVLPMYCLLHWSEVHPCICLEKKQLKKLVSHLPFTHWTGAFLLKLLWERKIFSFSVPAWAYHEGVQEYDFPFPE